MPYIWLLTITHTTLVAACMSQELWSYDQLFCRGWTKWVKISSQPPLPDFKCWVAHWVFKESLVGSGSLKNIRIGRIIYSGYFKNLKELEEKSTWVFGWFFLVFNFFDNHGYILKLVIWKIGESMGKWVYTILVKFSNQRIYFPHSKNHPTLVWIARLEVATCRVKALLRDTWR